MTKRLAIAIGFVLCCVAGAAGQCPGLFGDAGFDPGCCAPVTPNLPAFPAISMQADWAELLGCSATNQNTCQVQLSPATMVFCDYALIGVFVLFPGGDTISGTLAAKFARTWIDFPSGVGQVWRFLINGDLQCTASSSGFLCSSPLPTCAFPAPAGPVHFDGHLDYCCDPASPGTMTASMSLNHLQGCISHAPWSCKPLGGVIGHDERSWHLVGPSPFVFAPVPEPQGPIYAGSVRSSFLRVAPTFVYQCAGEAKAGPLGTLYTSSSAGCLCAVFDQCTGATVPCPSAGCYRNQQLMYPVCCGTAIAATYGSFPVAGTPVAQTGLIAQTLGSFGPSSHFPANGDLTIYWGVLTYSAPPGCQPVNWPLHVAVGVGVSNVVGQIFSTTICLGNPPLVNAKFVDLQNVLPLNTPGSLSPGYGCLAAADVVWSFSMQ